MADRDVQAGCCGERYRARDLLRHIACELGCNTWSGKATVILAGLGGDEADAFAEIGRDRIVTADSPSAAIATVRAELAHRGTTGVAAPATVLLLASPDAATRAALADLHRALTVAGRCGIAVVTTVPDGAPVGVAVLTVTDAGALKTDLPGLRQTTDAAAVAPDLLEPMAQVFRVAHLAPLVVPAATADELPTWDDSIDREAVLGVFEPVNASVAEVAPAQHPEAAEPPDADERDQLDDDLAAWHDPSSGRPRLGILGPVDVRMPGPLTDSRHRLYTEMLLYLLTRPHRTADRPSIENALWYGHPAGDGTVRKVASKLRRWLGPRTDGHDWIPTGDDDIYRVTDGILLDWHLMKRLLTRGIARGAAGIDDFTAALGLVRGVPMRGIPDSSPYRRPYTWIGDSDISPARITATIADLAHRVAARRIISGDTTAARWAIEQGWLADPERSFDDLWQDRMQVEHRDGQTATLRQLVNEYLATQQAEVLEDLPPATYNRIRALIAA